MNTLTCSVAAVAVLAFAGEALEGGIVVASHEGGIGSGERRGEGGPVRLDDAP